MHAQNVEAALLESTGHRQHQAQAADACNKACQGRAGTLGAAWGIKIVDDLSSLRMSIVSGSKKLSLATFIF